MTALSMPHGTRGIASQTVWMPLNNSERYGLELRFSSGTISSVLELLDASFAQSSQRDYAFAMVRLVDFGSFELGELRRYSDQLPSSKRVAVVLKAEEWDRVSELSGAGPVLYMLEVDSLSVALTSLVCDVWSGVKFEESFNSAVNDSPRGALLLDSLRSYCKEVGLVTFGPWIRDGLTVPVQFDYIPESAMTGILAKHRL